MTAIVQSATALVIALSSIWLLLRFVKWVAYWRRLWDLSAPDDEVWERRRTEGNGGKNWETPSHNLFE
jgi:hypothetical protein